MGPVGTIPSCPANPKWYIGMGVGIWAISDGASRGYPKLSCQSHVVHWDGIDSWDLSYQRWDHLGLSQVVLPIPSDTLGWAAGVRVIGNKKRTPGVVLLIPSGTLGQNRQLGFEQSVMGPLRTIPSCLTIPKWYSRIEQNPVDIWWQCWTSLLYCISIILIIIIIQVQQHWGAGGLQSPCERSRYSNRAVSS